MPAPVNLAEKLTRGSDYRSPKIVANYNGNDIMAVKVKGEFVWHSHEDTDDFFLVPKGRMKFATGQGDVMMEPGELFVVPRGVRHCPVAETETRLLLIEPAGTPNTGDKRTAAIKDTI